MLADDELAGEVLPADAPAAGAGCGAGGDGAGTAATPPPAGTDGVHMCAALDRCWGGWSDALVGLGCSRRLSVCAEKGAVLEGWPHTAVLLNGMDQVVAACQAANSAPAPAAKPADISRAPEAGQPAEQLSR